MGTTTTTTTTFVSSSSLLHPPTLKSLVHHVSQYFYSQHGRPINKPISSCLQPQHHRQIWRRSVQPFDRSGIR